MSVNPQPCPEGGGAVDSVNGQTGVVVLDADDVGAVAREELWWDLVNVQAREEPLMNAYGFYGDEVRDDVPHPLSDRWDSLLDAQSVFPRATALTEQIDRHAVQQALDNHPYVFCPPAEYQFDATVYMGDGTYGWGPDNQTLEGAGRATVFVPLADFDGIGVIMSGNARDVVTPNNPDSSEVPAATGCEWKNFVIRGDETGVPGLRIYHMNDRLYENLLISGCSNGIRDYGVSDLQTYGCTMRGVIAEDNTSNGLHVSLRNRLVTVESCLVRRNGARGVFLDSSQNTVAGLVAYENAEEGFYSNGNFRNDYRGIHAWNNGFHGIYLRGTKEMVGANWRAYGNGTAADNTYDDVHCVDDSHGTYGITRDSVVTGVQAGPSSDASGGGVTRYAIYVDDGVTDVAFRQVQAIEADTGLVRLPPGCAHGVTVDLLDGSQVANLVLATGAAETLAWGGVHRVNMDQNCTFSFTTAPPIGVAASMTVIVSGAFAPTWPAAVDWSGGSAPAYTTLAVYEFVTVDGGATVQGFLAGAAIA